MILTVGAGVAAIIAGTALARWARRRWIVVTVQGYSGAHAARRSAAHRETVAGLPPPGLGYARSDIVVFLLTEQ